MNKFKKIFNAIALSAILITPAALNSNAISTDSSGSATNLTFDGTWWTVAMYNCRINDGAGWVAIDNFGSGKGNIKFGAYCCQANYGTVNHYYTFKGTDKKQFKQQTTGVWGVDGTNTSLTKQRTGVNVSWDLEAMDEDRFY